MPFKFEFPTTEKLKKFCIDNNLDYHKTVILYRPIKSKLLRLANDPIKLENIYEFIQVCNTLCVTNKPINGVYYFKAESDEDVIDVGGAFDLMGIKTFFMIQNMSIITSEIENNIALLN